MPTAESVAGRTRRKASLPDRSCLSNLAREDLLRVISYIFKPIAVGKAYERAAGRNAWNASSVEVLNNEVNLFLVNLSLVFYDVHKIRRYGICHCGSTSRYIGYVTEHRKQRSEKAAKRRDELKKSGLNSSRDGRPADC